MNRPFSIYRSSAGSGKTRTLAKAYLKLALQHKSDYFKYILAVTFTNKASQEMKDRILFYLDQFARGENNDLATEIKLELGLDDSTFQQNSHAVRGQILHGYSQFSISTIDAFFQKVIRSFTRESGLMGDYRLEVDQDLILEEVVDNLIDELGSNEQLTSWVVEFAKENLENEKAWDIRHNLMEFSREIFKEEFKAIEDEVNLSTSEKDFFTNLRQKLLATRKDFLKSMRDPSREALDIIRSNGWTVDDFTGKSTSGLLTFLEKNASAKKITDTHEGGTKVQRDFIHPEGWAHKSSPHAAAIFQAARTRLAPIVTNLVNTYQSKIKEALSADVALNHLYVFGLISDIARKLKEYKDDNNLMLLSDAPKFLNGIIADSDTPFVYEKVGSFYRNYLIDEFQDTSGMQWQNFQPLITNSLDQGHSCLVVGDVKQAIYRWRGGDLNLLQNEIATSIGPERTRVEKLDRNFRSSENVVSFNNAFFKSASVITSTVTNTPIPTSVYEDVAQQVNRKERGFVQVHFLNGDPALTTDAGVSTPEKSWRQKSLEAIPKHLERLQEQGISLRDVAFLVRRNDEGQQIATYLLEYKNSENAVEDFSYDVVSNESLRIDSASSVNLILGAMQYLMNPDNAIARAQLVFEYSRIHEQDRAFPEIFEVTNQNIFENNLPELFTKQKSSLRKLSIVELTERIIEVFSLGGLKGEFVYLQAFQDLVLEFANRERNDLGAFLEWWEEIKRKKSVQLSGEVNAAQILTIHKSKGLQFRYVILPFCSWGLDHDNWQAPMLWVQSQQEPFADVGFIPLKYSSSLANTLFSQAYEEEKSKTYLDNLNLLYVALTRAERGMILCAPSPQTKSFKKTVAELLFEGIQTSPELMSMWNASEEKFSVGEIPVGEVTKNDLSNAVEMQRYLSHSWQQSLVLLKKGQNLFIKDDENQKARVDHGILIHEILSRMIVAEDLDSSLEKSILQGRLSITMKDEVRSSIRSLFDILQVAEWFREGWTVKTEIPIVMPGGEEARIDRLLIKDRTAIVIDFKTGTKSKSDSEQVQNYQNILRSMNFAHVEGYLLYLSDRSVVEVKEGKQKVTKKSAVKDQLSLGF